MLEHAVYQEEIDFALVVPVYTAGWLWDNFGNYCSPVYRYIVVGLYLDRGEEVKKWVVRQEIGWKESEKSVWNNLVKTLNKN